MKHKKVLLLNRCKTTKLYSIENVYSAIFPYLLKSNDFTVYSINLPCPSKPCFLLINCIYSLYLSFFYDLIHQTGDSHYVIPFCLFSKRVFTVHDLRQLYLFRGLKHSLYKFFWFSLPLFFASKVICISPFTQNALNKTFHLPSNKSVVILNPLSNHFFADQQKIRTSFQLALKGPIRFLVIGTRANKNVPLVLRVLSNLDIPFCLSIVGNPDDILPSQIQTLRSSIYCLCLNIFSNISNDEILSLYDQSDFLFFLSSYEGFGLPVLESQSRGVIPLVNNIQPMSSLCSQYNAILFDSLSHDHILEHFRQQLDKPYLLDQLRIEGYRNASKFDPHTIATIYSKLYRGLL